MTIQERIKNVEKEVMLLKAEAEADEHYKNTTLPTRFKLWLWDIETVRAMIDRGEVAK